LLSVKYAVDKLKKLHRAPLYHPALPVVLLWSPKAGCTVLTKWFFFQIGLLDKALCYHTSIHIYKGSIFIKEIICMLMQAGTLARERLN
jgi:hypothetical protein